MNRQQVVTYTWQEDFWLNTDLGVAILLWLIAFGLGMWLTSAIMANSKKPSLWWGIPLAACAIYTIHYGLVWALTSA